MDPSLVSIWLFFSIFVFAINPCWGQSSAIFSQQFLTDTTYINAVLSIPPYRTQEARNVLQCQASCASSTRCKSVAFGGSCISMCQMYDSNICSNSTVRVTPQPKFQIWDKVDSNANKSCKTASDFKSCMKSYYNRCSACKRDGFHGPQCQYENRGCPGKYQFLNGSCSLVVNVGTDYNSVDAKCKANYGGRFGLIRNSDANNMLRMWAYQLRLSKGIFIGVYKSGSTWYRKDKQLLNNTYTYWAPKQPDEHVQSVAVMTVTMNYSYNDDMDFVLRNYICEVAPENCTEYQLQANYSDGTCYNLYLQQLNFTDAIAACLEENGTLVKVRDLETHRFLWDFLNDNKLNPDAYVGILSSRNATHNGMYYDGTPVDFDLPWADGQPNFLKESVGLLQVNGQWDDVLHTMTNGYVCEYIAKSCSEWRRYGHLHDGLFRLLPQGTIVDFEAQCDMTIHEGGWTVIQNRQGDASVNFNRTMADYKAGFGNTATGDYWLGLDKMILLQMQDDLHLCIETVNSQNISTFIVYSDFQIVNVTATSYKLYLGAVILTSNDSQANQTASPINVLSALNGTSFFTYDVNNATNCASPSGGGWWFSVKGACGNPGANGPYSGNGTALQWGSSTVKTIRMKIRPKVYFDL